MGVPDRRPVTRTFSMRRCALLSVVCLSTSAILSVLVILPNQASAQGVSNAVPHVIKQADWSGQPKYRSDELLVRFRSGTSRAAADSLHQTLGGQHVRSWSSIEGLQLVRLAAATQLKDALRAYR